MFLSKALPPSIRKSYNIDTSSGMLVAIFAGLTSPFIGVIARDQLHASPMMLGVMTAAPFVGNLFAMFWANAMEGKNKLPFIVWSTFFARALFFLMVFATTPGVFAAIVCASSILTTIAGPAYAAVMKDIYPKRVRGRAMAYVRVCTVSTTVIAIALAGPILQHASYQLVFPIATIFGIASALHFSGLKTGEVEPVEKTKTHEFLINTIMILKHDKAFRWFAISVFTVGFGTITVAPLYPIFQVDTLHITTMQLSIIVNLSAIMTILSYFYWGPFVDKTSPLKGAAISVFLMAVTPVTYAFAHSWVVLIPAALIQGVANAGIELSYFNAILRFAPAERVSHYQALFSSLLGVRGAVAPMIGASLVEHGVFEMQTLFLASAGFCLVGVVMQAYGARRY